jgi:hypothetical protein
MVEGFGLPEDAGAGEECIDVVAGGGFPGLEDGGEGLGVGDVQEDVDVVGHDDEVAKAVELGVVVAHGGFEEVAGGGAAEFAVAVGGIEEAFDGDGPECMELGVLLGGVRQRVALEPLVAGLAEFIEVGGGEGVVEAEGDEVEDVGLTEVRETVAVLEIGAVPIEGGDGGVHEVRLMRGGGFGKGRGEILFGSERESGMEPALACARAGGDAGTTGGEFWRGCRWRGRG